MQTAVESTGPQHAGYQFYFARLSIACWAIVIVRTIEGKPGTIRVTAASDKLASATATCESVLPSTK